MDANHDGVLTSAENMAAAQSMFARMDANHDGVCDGERAFRLRLGAERKRRRCNGSD